MQLRTNWPGEEKGNFPSSSNKLLFGRFERLGNFEKMPLSIFGAIDHERLKNKRRINWPGALSFMFAAEAACRWDAILKGLNHILTN